MQSQVQYSEKGIFIPFDWFEEMGQDVHVQKIGEVIFIETARRQAARKRLQDMVNRLRNASRESDRLSQDELTKIIEEVRERRAGHC